MSNQKRYPRLSLAAFITAALFGVLGFVQAEGFFALSAFLGLIGVILRRGVSAKYEGDQFAYDSSPIRSKDTIPLRRIR